VSGTEAGLPDGIATAASSGAMLPPDVDETAIENPATEPPASEAPIGGESADAMDPEEG
jgi:hypothetical protein